VSPGEARAACNIRFNDLHTPEALLRQIESKAQTLARETGSEIFLSHTVGGVAFVTKPGAFIDVLSQAIFRVTGTRPQLSTTGGTSDARFIKDHGRRSRTSRNDHAQGGRVCPGCRDCSAGGHLRSNPRRLFRLAARMNRRPIGIFDSGMGGLTVLRALVERLPNEQFIYLGDTARLPYGTKSAETVMRYSVKAASVLIDRGIKLLVVACNTASSVALPVAAAPSGTIAVIATEGTVNGGAYVRAIRALAPDANVIQQACPLFVPLAEEGLIAGEIATAVTDHYLRPFLQAQPRCLVLGCTHFPVLRDVIAGVAGPGVVLVDSAATAAGAVEGELLRRNVLREEPPAGHHRFLVTDAPNRFLRVGEIFFGRPIDRLAVELVDLQ
jgi:glutamate racemase